MPKSERASEREHEAKRSMDLPFFFCSVPEKGLIRVSKQILESLESHLLDCCSKMSPHASFPPVVRAVIDFGASSRLS
jgi:hypothetical protein